MTGKLDLFKKINTFFDRVFIITLKESTDRQELLSNTLEGLDYEICWGVNGKELKNTDLIEEGSGNDALTLGEVGCAMSHLSVYKKIIDLDLNNALILEDDLVLKTINSEDIDTLNFGLKELPADWELIYLGYALNNNKMSYSTYLRTWIIYPLLSLYDRNRYNPFKFRRRFPRKYSQHLQKAGYHYRTHSYGISKSGAQKMLDFQTPVKLASDNAISEMCINNKLNAFRLKKRIFFQNRDLESTIKGRYNKSKSPHKH